MLCCWYWHYFRLTDLPWFGCFGNECITVGTGTAGVLTRSNCCFMGYTQPNVDSFILTQASVMFWLWLWVRLVRCCLVPFSPLLFCWWVELADRSSGTAMGSSASSDASLAGGLSLPADTHQQTPISHHETPPRVSFRRSKITSGWCKSMFVGLLYLPFALYASIMQ